MLQMSQTAYCLLPAQISRMTLEVQHVGDPSVAPRDQSTAPAWKPSVVSVNLPAQTGPSLVRLIFLRQA